jgi:hypothetical protein
MIVDKWDERMEHIAVEVTTKARHENRESSVASKVSNTANPARSGVTIAWTAETNAEGIGDTCSSPSQDADEPVPVDWATLTIIAEVAEDGEANAIVDEEAVYEAMGFKAADERAEEATREEIPIPAMTSKLQGEMDEAAILVDDIDGAEPLNDSDRDNPNMSVGTHYPCMYDFRLEVKQHAIVNEFELGTEKSDKNRFRGFCKAVGHPCFISDHNHKAAKHEFICGQLLLCGEIPSCLCRNCPKYYR